MSKGRKHWLDNIKSSGRGWDYTCENCGATIFVRYGTLPDEVGWLVRAYPKSGRVRVNCPDCKGVK